MTIDEARDHVSGWSDHLRDEWTPDEAAERDAERDGVLALLDELDARRKADNSPRVVLSRDELLSKGWTLAGRWVEGATAEVLDCILSSRPTAVAAALAAIVAEELDQRDHSGPTFCKALAERAANAAGTRAAPGPSPSRQPVDP